MKLLIFSFIMMIFSIIGFCLFNLKWGYKKLSYFFVLCYFINSAGFGYSFINIITKFF